MTHFSFHQRLMWGVQVLGALALQKHREIVPLLEKSVPRDGVIIDVGACEGQFTKLFAKAVPQGHVYAFEPRSTPRSVLAKVISFRKLGNVSLFPMGLGDQPSEEIPLSGGCPVMSNPDEKISLTTLDQFAFRHDLKRVDFIRADIRGSEMKFLLGAHHVIERFRPALLLDIDDARLHEAGASAEEVWRFLTALNYRIDRVEGGHLLTPLSAPITAGDIWCVPNEPRKAA